MDKPKSHKNQHYVDNVQFFKDMKGWKIEVNKALKKKQPIPKMPDSCGAAILKIATGLSMKSNFVIKKYREELVSDAVENCIMYAKNFNPRKFNNPFSYFTQMCYYAFLRRIAKEKKQTYIRYKLMHDVSSIWDANNQHNAQPDDNAVHALDNLEMDSHKMEDFIMDYEKKHFSESFNEQTGARGAPVGRRKRKKRGSDKGLGEFL